MTAPMRARRDNGDTLTLAPKGERLACRALSMLQVMAMAIRMLIARIATW